MVIKRIFLINPRNSCNFVRERRWERSGSLAWWPADPESCHLPPHEYLSPQFGRKTHSNRWSKTRHGHLLRRPGVASALGGCGTNLSTQPSFVILLLESHFSWRGDHPRV